MAEYLIQDTTLDAIANAINAKTGGSSAMTPAEMVTAIGNIQTGGADISPYKFVQGTITLASDSYTLIFPCGDITTPYFLMAKIPNFEDYLSAEYNGKGLGRVYYTSLPYYNNRNYGQNSSINVVLAVYNGAFDKWSTSGQNTVNNGMFTLSGHNNVTFSAGSTLEYIILGV